MIYKSFMKLKNLQQLGQDPDLSVFLSKPFGLELLLILIDPNQSNVGIERIYDSLTIKPTRVTFYNFLKVIEKKGLIKKVTDKEKESRIKLILDERIVSKFEEIINK